MINQRGKKMTELLSEIKLNDQDKCFAPIPTLDPYKYPQMS